MKKGQTCVTHIFLLREPLLPDLKMLSVAVDCIPDAFIVFKHLQTGPSMTFKVYDDHSKMVYDDHSSTEK